MKYDFSKVVLIDIEGKPLPSQDGHKLLANGLYNLAKDLDLVDKAMKIHKGEEVELDKTEIEQIKEFINSQESGFFSFAKKQMLAYIDSVKD